MKFRFGGACASIILLAGCSGGDPGSQLGQLRGAASSTAEKNANLLAAARPGARDASQSIANSPDRGALMSYRNNRTASKQEGAYTWYPVAISEEHAIKSLLTGEMTIPSPDGSQVKLRYERHEEHPDGNWTWVGRLVDGDQMQEAIITFGEKAVYGSIPQPNGAAPLSLQTRSGSLFAVITDLSKQKSPNSGTTDMMVPPALALRESLAQQVQQSAPVQQSATVMASAPPTSANTIDVAVGYTQGFRAREGSQSAAVTRLTFLMQVANQAYTNSNINGYLRMVRAVEVNYADNTKNSDVLSALTGHNGTSPVSIPSALQPLHTARNEYGADVVVLVRKFQTPENDGCGIAWLNGANQTAIVPSVDDDFGFAVVSDGSDTGTDGNSYFCAPETLVHEVGHVMGSAHDRDNSRKNDNSLQYGAYAYSFGMKTDSSNGNFYTIMAYGDNNQHFYRTFSNPSVLKCGSAGNLACGVANQTDNARSLNQTIPVVANFRATVVPFRDYLYADFDGSGQADILWRNISTGANEIWLSGRSTTKRTVSTLLTTNWTIVGIGDFNGDGAADILWRNAVSGANAIWRSGNSATQLSVATVADLSWKVAGIGDFDGDKKSDILWRNVSTGANEIWRSGSSSTKQAVSTLWTTNWKVVGVGDFNGDGKSDILWRNSVSGINAIWLSANSATQQSITNVTDLSRKIVGVGDFNADGKSDILWRNSNSGANNIWLSGNSATTQAVATLLSTNWKVVAIADYNGDNKSDILWRNSVSGANALWYSANSTTQMTVTKMSDLNWKVVPQVDAKTGITH